MHWVIATNLILFDSFILRVIIIIGVQIMRGHDVMLEAFTHFWISLFFILFLLLTISSLLAVLLLPLFSFLFLVLNILLVFNLAVLNPMQFILLLFLSSSHLIDSCRSLKLAHFQTRNSKITFFLWRFESLKNFFHNLLPC